MGKKIAVLRLTGLAFAVVFLCSGILSMLDRARMSAEFRERLGTRPMEATVDFSKRGVTKASFRQICSRHGVNLCLKTMRRFEGQESPEERLGELSATVVITDTTGHEIRRTKIDRTTIRRRSGGDKITLSGFPPFPTGDYSLTIDVDTPVSSLAGEKPVLYAEYSYCGCERTGEWIAGALALGQFFIGICLAIFVAPGLVRYGLWSHTCMEDAPQRPEANGRIRG